MPTGFIISFRMDNARANTIFDDEIKLIIPFCGVYQEHDRKGS